MRSFPTTLFAAAVLTVGLAAAAPSRAAPTVTAAWSRPAAQGTTGAGFMTLSSPKVDALVAVETPVAASVQMHQSMMHDGMAMMMSATSIPIPAGATVTLSPGGYHLMLLQLRKPLNPGDRVPVTLSFASGAKVRTSLLVGLKPPAPDTAKP